jgi:hypothetical protein
VGAYFLKVESRLEEPNQDFPKLQKGVEEITNTPSKRLEDPAKDWKK